MPPSHSIGNTTLAFNKVWHSVDAKNRVLGRLANRIALTLMGKHKPIYDPASDCGDYVIVKNAKQIITTGNKSNQIIYRNHTSYPGGLQQIPFKSMQQKKPDEIIRHAVSGMLPKNRLRKRMLERLLIFTDEKVPDSVNANKVTNYVQGDQPSQISNHMTGWKGIGGRRGPHGGPRWHKSSFGRA